MERDLGYEYMLMSLEDKEFQEKDLDEFTYNSQLPWQYKKRIISSTNVRAWHIEVNGTHYRIIQNRVPAFGDRLSAYVANNKGVVEDGVTSRDALFYNVGVDWLHGLEYLLRHLEGEDISRVRLDKDELGIEY